MKSLQLVAANPDAEAISDLHRMAVKYYFRGAESVDDYVVNSVENRLEDHLGDYRHNSCSLVVSDAGITIASHTEEDGMRVTALHGESDYDRVRALVGAATAVSAPDSPPAYGGVINWEEFKFRFRQFAQSFGLAGEWEYGYDFDGDPTVSLVCDAGAFEVTAVRMHPGDYPQHPDHVFYVAQSNRPEAEAERGEGDLTEDTWRKFSALIAGCTAENE